METFQAKMLHCIFLLLTFALSHELVVDSENNTHTLVISDLPVTWLEGQTQCAEKNGRLLSSDDFFFYLQEALNKVSGDFWIGDIQKVSEWIHILGCYSKASIRNKLFSPINFTIGLTPGRCQEYCLNEKMSLFFAIKEETCYCLKPDFNLPYTSSVTKCNYNCTSEEPKACGSKTAQFLSVYKTTNTSDIKGDGKCLRITCIGNKGYRTEKCSVSLTPYCSNNYTGTAGDWTEANAMCLKGNGHLDGDANLHDPTSKCNEIKMRIQYTYEFWLGILRQVYNTTDKDDIGPVVGGVFGGVILVAGVFLLSVIIIRRHKIGRREDQNTLKFENETPTSVSELKVHQPQDNGFSRYPEMNSTTMKEETYYKSQDEYDILGKRRSKVKRTIEHIYNHTESTTNQNCYASAAQVSKRISGEDLYDHTNEREYGTVSEIENDSMYSES
ncbi:uncharacterized protein LOC133195158 [Saccostrea echinata]|uniref:uncharacterized protein LOC133195158 n=1 Tax=Saccostrea echinata TaxID=191078 RepID=UPI002A817177|nr:uncharacterized protein LOC133195158 [Saccostrea echinata]